MIKEGRFGLKIVYPDNYKELYEEGFANINICEKCKYYSSNRGGSWFCSVNSKNKNDSFSAFDLRNSVLLKNGFQLPFCCPYKFESEYLVEDKEND